ncbi:MAG: hypothetical protein M9918_20935 [Anaerolineae bacterium]|nr:hypothetical protein [Anaerolineae bacterium]MCO5190640.1 hypothetical protein [Anaerolineae bacterium]MCO5192064.1 hypothetical protein [Anaerolineae bacterium]
MMDRLPQNTDESSQNKQAYQIPEIIYEGIISTRAGSNTSPTGPGPIPAPDNSADPADLFGG